LGRVPLQDEQMTASGLAVTVVECDKRTLRKVRVRPLPLNEEMESQ